MSKPSENAKATGVALPAEMQNAGVGTSHWNVAAPKHLGALDPEREQDSRVRTRLTSHADVPEWKKNKEEATENYSRELFEEAKRLSAIRIREEEISVNGRLKLIRQKFEEEIQKKIEKAQDSIQTGMKTTFERVSELPKHIKASLWPGAAEGAQTNDTKKKDDKSKDDKDKDGKRKKRAAAKMPEARIGFFGAAPKWLDEEPEPEDEEGARLPCGQCECGGEEFLCAHCDYIRCRKCELAMWQVFHLGALVCDRCYVWYRKPDTKKKDGKRKKRAAAKTDQGSSSSDDSEESSEEEAGGKGEGAAAGEGTEGKKRDKKKKEKKTRPVKKHGNGRWQPPPKPNPWEELPNLLLGKKRRGGAKSEEDEKAEAEEEENGPGYCESCYVDSNKQRKVTEYVCAHCDYIYCPYCQLDYKEAKAIGALLCERCYVIWERSREILDSSTAKNGAVTAPFPAPIKDIKNKAVVRKDGAKK